MKWLIYLFSGLLLLQGSTVAASPGEPIKVVTTLTVLKDFARQIGKERVEVTNLLSGLENQHTYTPSPADILAIQRADILVKVGLGLEVWIEDLIKNAENPNLMIVITSTGIPLLKESQFHESGGDSWSPTGKPVGRNPEQRPPAEAGACVEGLRDTHPIRNPHVWLDPENAKIMIQHITQGLIKLDPDHQSFYLNHQTAYFKKLDILQKSLIDKVNLLPNRKIITHHDAWPYFARRFGFTIKGNIMIQAGTEPSARKITELIKTIKRENVRVIISEPQLNPLLPRILEEETGARIAILTPIPEMLKGVETYYSMIEYNIETLITALRE